MSYQNCEGPSIDTISTGVEIGGINICIVISYYPFISKPFDISLFLLTSPPPSPFPSHTHHRLHQYGVRLARSPRVGRRKLQKRREVEEEEEEGRQLSNLATKRKNS